MEKGPSQTHGGVCLAKLPSRLSVCSCISEPFGVRLVGKQPNSLDARLPPSGQLQNFTADQ